MGALEAALAAWFVAQMIKFTIQSIKSKKVSLVYLVASGSMPSSHSAMVVALTVRIGITEGITSPLFAACVVFSLIIMYDAAGVRRSVGVQARKLNEVLEHFNESHQVDITKLREILGHTPVEVFVGSAIGALMAIVWPR